MKLGNVLQPAVLAYARTVYVIRENPSNEIGSYLKTAIAGKGYRVSSGSLAATRQDADLSVDYVDSWK